jgi:hypothetical protein
VYLCGRWVGTGRNRLCLSGSLERVLRGVWVTCTTKRRQRVGEPPVMPVRSCMSF